MKKYFFSTAFLLLATQSVMGSNKITFHYNDDPKKPVSGGGALLFKSYFEDHPDGHGEDLCLLVGHEKNLGYWSLPAGGAEATDTIMVNGVPKQSILATIKRETKEETGGVVIPSDQDPILYSRKFGRAFAVIADDTLGCNQLTKAVTDAINNPNLGACWKEMDKYTAVSVNEIIRKAEIIRKHWETIAPTFTDKNGQPCTYQTLWHHHATKNLPAEVSPGGTAKGPTITLTARNGQSISFGAFYFGSIVDKINDFKHHVGNIRLPKGFSPKTYLDTNPDLKSLTIGKNLSDIDGIVSNHYRTHGKTAGLLFALPTNFESEVYLARHPDIKAATSGMSQQQAFDFAKQHYSRSGHKVNRSYGIPNSFDFQLYLYMNPDIEKAYSSMSAEKKAQAARLHFYFNGKAKGRPYKLPRHFDAHIYLDLNKEAKTSTTGMSQKEIVAFAKKHYAQIGMREGKPYGVPEDFDIDSYYALNPDVAKAAEGMTKREKDHFAKRHYTFNGKAKGRRY